MISCRENTLLDGHFALSTEFLAVSQKYLLVLQIRALQQKSRKKSCIFARFPGIGLIRELAYTGRIFSAKEAKDCGFVVSVEKDREQLMDKVEQIAKTIAEKSPVAVQSTKISMNYARDHTIEEGLNQIATWNGACLMSDDLMKSALAMKERKTPADVNYDNL